MILNQWYKLSTIRRFQIFYLVTAVLPMLVFLWAFFGVSYGNWRQNDQQLLRSGLLYLESIQTAGRLTPAQEGKLTSILPEFKFRILNAEAFKRKLWKGNESALFEDRLDGKRYWTGAVRDNYSSKTILLSIPQDKFDPFNQASLMLFSLFLIVILGFIIAIGLWFESDLVKPLNALARAAEQVANGNLKDRIQYEASLNSEAKDTIEHFNQMLDKLEKHQKLRSTFISTLSHDLKTPLMAQKRALQLLEEEFQCTNVPTLNRLVHALNTNNASQLRMVTKLLDIFRFEEGEFPLRFESVSLFEAVNECLTELHPLANEHQISIHNNLSGDLPDLEGDYGQIKRIFTNLLSNAIQNIPEGSIVWITGDVDTDFIHVEVKDDGTGIDSEILPYVFDPYFTLHRTRKKINTGLGLSICRMIVEAHHGQIRVESQPGQGTVFYITLPMSQDVWKKKGSTVS